MEAKMRIFMTGANGYIGSVVAEKLIDEGNEVIGLARRPVVIEKLSRAGVTPLEGDLRSLALLTQAASQADGVIHLGLDLSGPSFADVMDVDRAAVRALAAGLAGTEKGFVTTSGTGVATPAADGGKTDESTPFWSNPLLSLRAAAEADALSAAANGVRISAIRLPPFVYGRGSSSFVPMLLKAAFENGVSPYVKAGDKLTSAVHVDDTAQLYLLALKSAPARSVFNCTTEISIPLRALAETIGVAVSVPARSVSRSDAEAMVGPFVATFLDVNSRPSSTRAREQLGWRPQSRSTLLGDIADGSYRDLIERLTR